MPEPRILIIDDDDQIQKFLRHIFSMWEIEAVSFEDPSSAIGEVQKHHYDIIFLDIDMPRMSGIELLEKLTKVCHDTEIVMMTGNEDLEAKQRSLEIGAFALLDKPFQLDELSQVVSSALESVRESRLEHRRLCPGIVRDLMACRRTEAAGRHTEQLALMGRLAASMSHELRNPLNAVFLHLDLMQEDLRRLAPASQAHLAVSLAEIRTELTRMHELVEDYLSLARLATLARQPADLGTCVADWAEEYAEQLASRGITLVLEGLDSLGEVAFHAATVRSAMTNLIQNALEAMPDGGTLTLRGRRTAAQVHLAVRDTGIGIPEDELPLIFEPLHTTKPEGTGLGLYLVQEIVVAHGGTIQVQSAPGQGSTFTMSLPCAAEEAAQGEGRHRRLARSSW
jgi:two-component system sensor histidine kinase HydH